MTWRLRLRCLLPALALLVGAAGLPANSNAATAAAAPCRPLVLVLAPSLNAAAVEQAWASGEPRDEVPATLEWRRCDGRVIDRLVLDGALARLDPRALRGAPVHSVLVTVDLTAPAGSNSGPLTDVIELRGEHLVRAQAASPDGASIDIRLSATGKAAWRRALRGGRDELLAVSCRPTAGGFVMRWRRFVATREGWRMVEREAPGFWESDQPFPPEKAFPSSKAIGR
jgi:hypothetical protein